MYRSVNINKEWANSVTFNEFKKNAIIANLKEGEPQRLYEELTGKKVKTKKIEGGE